MALSERVMLYIDVVALPFYFGWFYCIGNFLFNTPPEELPDRHLATIFFSVWFAALFYHGTTCIRNKRIFVLAVFYRQVKSWIREYLLEYVVETPVVWDILVLLHLREVCIVANVMFEICFITCLLLVAAANLYDSHHDRDTKFWVQNFTFLVMYCTTRVRFRNFYDVDKLITHFAYTCVHLGCYFDSLHYEGSYFFIQLGVTISILYVVWHLLGAPYDASSSENTQDDEPKPLDSPPEVSPTHEPKSPKETQWKPKTQKKKRKH